MHLLQPGIMPSENRVGKSMPSFFAHNTKHQEVVMSIALLLVDIQNDYFPGGSMELVGAHEAARNAARLLSAFRQRALPIIHIQHIAVTPSSTFFLPGTTGAEIQASVRPNHGEPVFQKHFPNSFRQTQLLEHLQQKNITKLVIVGMMTHMCIDTTVRAAADLGFACSLPHDACATKGLSFGGAHVPAESVQAAYLAAMNGTFANVASTDDLLAAL